MSLNKQLEKAGINPEELNIRNNLMHLLFDVSFSYGAEIEDMLRKAGGYKFQNKKSMELFKKYGDELVETIEKSTDKENMTEGFISDSEFFRELLLILALKVTDKNKIKVLSYFKNMKEL